MPILAVNPHTGQLYATSPDRADGLGFGYAPECETQQDLTLGSAYLKANQRRTADLLKSKRQQEIMDRNDRVQSLAKRQQRVNAQQREAKVLAMMEQPEYKEAALKRAVSMGCSCEYSTKMSGNVLTANGQSGFGGMTRDQQVIHHAVYGMGANTAYKVDSVEAEQHRMRQEAQRLLRLRARR